MSQLAVLGELLVDFTASPIIDGFQYNPGGGPANMAMMAAKRGCEVSFISQVGSDAFGRRLRKKLEEAGIDTEALSLSDVYPTTLAFVHHGEKGERSFSFYRHGSADTMIEVTEMAKRKIEEADMFFLSSVLMSEGSSRDTSFALMQYAKELGKIVVFDPNLRPNLWNSETEMKETVLKALSVPDIIKMSEEELAFLTGEEGLIPGIMCLENHREEPVILIVTQGEEGCTVFLDGEMMQAESFEVEPVDTTGAGDAFMGAFAGEWLKKKLDPETVTMEDLLPILTVANACGALTTTAMGGMDAQPGDRDIENLLQKFA